MSSDEIQTSKNSSPFLSIFSRKKRINSVKSSNDRKLLSNNNASVHNNSNGQATGITNLTTTNGYYIDSENSESLVLPVEMASTSWAEESVPTKNHNNQPQEQQQSQESPLSTSNRTFTDRIRYHKNSRKHKRTGTLDGTDEILSTNPGNLPNNARSRSETRTVSGKSPILMAPKKAYSVDAVNQSSDSTYLMEALETLADVQPRVARSIPKHATVDTSNFAAHSLDNCLFDAHVYDTMLHDSIKVCEMLQNHLSQCIMTVRGKSPEGHLDVVNEESEDDTETTFSQEKDLKNLDRNRLSSAMTSSTVTSSTDNTGPFELSADAKLKTKVHFKDC